MHEVEDLAQELAAFLERMPHNTTETMIFVAAYPMGHESALFDLDETPDFAKSRFAMWRLIRIDDFIKLEDFHNGAISLQTISFVGITGVKISNRATKKWIFCPDASGAKQFQNSRSKYGHPWCVFTS